MEVKRVEHSKGNSKGDFLMNRGARDLIAKHFSPKIQLNTVIPKKGGCIQYAATHIDRNVVRGSSLKPSPGQLCIATWNVEGLTEAKLATVETYTQEYGIHMFCLQEIRRPLSDYCVIDNGFLLICYGGHHSLEYAHVGFLVHPTLRNTCIIFFSTPVVLLESRYVRLSVKLLYY